MHRLLVVYYTVQVNNTYGVMTVVVGWLAGWRCCLAMTAVSRFTAVQCNEPSPFVCYVRLVWCHTYLYADDDGDDAATAWL